MIFFLNLMILNGQTSVFISINHMGYQSIGHMPTKQIQYNIVVLGFTMLCLFCRSNICKIVRVRLLFPPLSFPFVTVWLSKLTSSILRASPNPLPMGRSLRTKSSWKKKGNRQKVWRLTASWIFAGKLYPFINTCFKNT